MSADGCVVYYGLRYELSEHELEALELRTDWRIVAARDAGLKHYWGNFAAPDEQYLLFVGTELGVFGPENRLALEFERGEIEKVMAETADKLREARLQGEPKLHVQWWVDA